MIGGEITASLRSWLITLFINSIRSISKEDDRQEVLRWLELSRQVIDSDRSTKDKFTELYALMDSRRTAQIVLNSVVESVKNYKNADLPLAVKVAIPFTLLAVPFIGGQGAGLVAMGGAIGLPVLLLIFLGSAGITSIIEAIIGNAQARTYLGGIMALIAHDEVLRQIRAAIKAGAQGAPREPVRTEMPEDEIEIRAKLLTMDPYEFENHVMSFFRHAGLDAVPTSKSSDRGIDGFAKCPDGRLIVVQCKRYASENPVGSPDIQQFWGAVEGNKAHVGYFVTTSYFTEPAKKVADDCEKIVLIEINELVRWHKNAPAF